MNSKLFIFLWLLVLVIISGCNATADNSNSYKYMSIEEEELVQAYCGNLQLIKYDYDNLPEQEDDSVLNSKKIDYQSSNNVDDPLAYYQWGLSNRGQIYVNNAQVDILNDINVEVVHNTYMIRGKGVVINVIDSGLEARHEDLRVDIDNSYNFYHKINDPTPTLFHYSELNCKDHGTAVGGVIAAKSGNKVGGVGVAPAATLIGFNLLQEYNSNNEKIAFGLPNPGEPQGAKTSSIMNMSFGFSDTGFSDPVELGVKYLLQKGVSEGRGGLGYIYIKSSGNGFANVSGTYNIDCSEARALSISCQTSNYDPYFVEPYTIKISASNAKGKLASYSTTGSSVFVNAPSGEYSIDPYSRIISGSTTQEMDIYKGPATLTTDLMGCMRGTSYDSEQISLNNFDFNWSNSNDPTSNTLNKDCSYTSGFNGTSSAAAIVSGFAALILEKNPSLTWRAVKHILASTSTQNDPSCQGVYASIYADQFFKSNSSDPLAYQIDQCWFINAAGLSFSNWYGFGRINAKEAVDMAGSISANHYSFSKLRSYGDDIISGNILLGNKMQIKENYIPSLASIVPDYFNQKDITQDLHIAALTVNQTDVTITKIDSVTIILSIATSEPNKILARLTSPGFTRSIILHPFNSLGSGENINYSGFLSNAFWGESPIGDWYLEIYNLSFQSLATLDYAGFILYGS